MTPWYWYASRPNEIFLDLDSKRAMARALHVIRRVIQRRLLKVDSVWLYPTQRPHHAHLIIVLGQFMGIAERVSWSLWCGSDRIRAVYVLERVRAGVLFPDVLCSRREYGFRLRDLECSCTVEKHKRHKATNDCPALQALIGDERNADYFPRNQDRRTRAKLTVPWGRIPKKTFKDW